MRSTARRRVLFAVLLAIAASACGTDQPATPPASIARPDNASAGPALGDSLAEFEGRLRDATTREGALVRVVAAASAGSRRDLGLAVIQLRRWVDDERAWLSGHPPLPCYDAAATKFEAALDAMTAAADGFARVAGASAGPSDDAATGSAGAAGATGLQDAARALLDAAALAKTARPTAGRRCEAGRRTPRAVPGRRRGWRAGPRISSSA